MAEQNWRDVDNDEFERRNVIAQSRRTAGDFQGYWTPKVGSAGAAQRNVLRIMPPHHNMTGDPFVSVKMHFLPSNEISQKTGKPIVIGVNCLKQFGGKVCPACDMASRLLHEAEGEADVDAAKRFAKGLTAKDRMFIQMIDVDDQAKGVQRYAFGIEVEKKLRAAFYDDEGAWRNVTHPRNGRDIIMKVGKRAGTDFNDYDVRAKESSSPIADMGWLEQITDLSELLREPRYEDVEMATRGERPQPPQGTQAQARPAAQPKAAPKPEPKPEPKAEIKSKPPKAAPKPEPEPKVEEPEAEAEPEPVIRERKPRRPAELSDPDRIAASTEPYAAARVAWRASMDAKPFLDDKITPFSRVIPMDPAKLPAALQKTRPQCYEKETDVNDDTCRTCALMLPCLEAVLASRAS